MVRHCDEAAAKPDDSVDQAHRHVRICEDCVLDRSLASLLSGYTGRSQLRSSSTHILRIKRKPVFATVLGHI